MTRAPHYLRVVQALALVSGFSPVAVAIVAGAAVTGCTTGSGANGAFCGPEGNANGCGDYDGGTVGVIIDGNLPIGALDAVSLPSDAADAGPDASDAETDATIGDGSTDAPADATPDVTTDGGPLPPPDLPV
ncbi:MAG: hypothetical protein ACLQBL_27055 [Polyangiaceae bacterium]